jgi:hypothetical protein
VLPKARECRGQRLSRAGTEPHLVLIRDVGHCQPAAFEVAKADIDPEVERRSAEGELHAHKRRASHLIQRPYSSIGRTLSAARHVFTCDRCGAEAGRLTIYAPRKAVPARGVDEFGRFSRLARRARLGRSEYSLRPAALARDHLCFDHGLGSGALLPVAAVRLIEGVLFGRRIQIGFYLLLPD